MKVGEVCEMHKHVIIPVPTSHIILPSARPAWQTYLIVASVTLNVSTVLALLYWRLG